MMYRSREIHIILKNVVRFFLANVELFFSVDISSSIDLKHSSQLE